jgi:hypothetical protein
METFPHSVRLEHSFCYINGGSKAKIYSEFMLNLFNMNVLVRPVPT